MLAVHRHQARGLLITGQGPVAVFRSAQWNAKAAEMSRPLEGRSLDVVPRLGMLASEVCARASMRGGPFPYRR